jgi:hypothetical protein
MPPAERNLRDLDLDVLFAAERALPSYRSELRERALSRARLERPNPAAPSARWAWRRQVLVAAGVLLALVSAAAAAFQLRQRRERAAELSPVVSPVLSPVGGVASPVRGVAPPASSLAGARSTETSLRAEQYRRELRILEPARRAFARGDFAAVVRAADEHERAFPAGGLAEERDALRVRALFRQNRVAEARGAAAAFRRQFPNSAVLGEIGK